MNLFKKLPQINILEIYDKRCLIQFEFSSWVGEDWIAYICVDKELFIQGRFSNVNTTDNICSFTPQDAGKVSLLKIGNSYHYTNGYWGERAELVLDSTKQWQRAKFKPSDALSVSGNFGAIITKFPGEPLPDMKIIKGGWDHEHCVVCCEKIGEGGQKTAFVHQENDWLCEMCHKEYVEPLSLAFIPDYKS